MSEATFAGVLVVAGVLGFVISQEVRQNAEYRSTARRALLSLVISVVAVVGGLYWAFQIQAG